MQQHYPYTNCGTFCCNVQSVAGHIGTVNITIPGHLTAVVYEFQVSAAITVGGQLNEGTSSTVTPESTVLLPNPREFQTGSVLVGNLNGN